MISSYSTSIVKKRERAKFVPPLIRCGVEALTIDDLIQLDRKHALEWDGGPSIFRGELRRKATWPFHMDGGLSSESSIRNAFE
jgi:hypothetical protein